jgi:hypothetical protein
MQSRHSRKIDERQMQPLAHPLRGEMVRLPEIIDQRGQHHPIPMCVSSALYAYLAHISSKPGKCAVMAQPFHGRLNANAATIPRVTGVESRYVFCHRHHILGPSNTHARQPIVVSQTRSRTSWTATRVADSIVAIAQQTPVAA